LNTIKNTPLFFILGRERSGTTMLRLNLNNHSHIHIPPESPFIIHLHKKYHNKKNIDLKRFIYDLKQEPFLLNWRIDYSVLREKLQNINPPTFQNYCTAILNQYSKNDIILGDKNPSYSLFGDKLHQIYPNAKFIWIIRDYRAQVNSMLKVNFERKIISSLAARWVSYNKEIEKIKNKFPEQVLLIKYEDLVTSPEKHYKNICTFLELDFEQSVLSTAKIKKEFQPKHHTSLEEKINTKHIKEWETELSVEQIKICEAVAGDYGECFGYKKTINHNSLTYFGALLGIFYGKCYKYFIKLMYSLPLRVRVFINYKIIYKNASFWKELKNYYDG